MRGAHTEHSQIDHLAAVWKLSGYKSPSKAQQCIISAQAKLFFLPPGFFGELGQQTSVVVTCLTFLRCSFPKGHQRSTQQVVKLTTYCALQCHQNYKSRLINRLFSFSLFFPDMISGVELVCSVVPCMYPAKIAPRFMCRAEDRKFWREIEK